MSVSEICSVDKLRGMIGLAMRAGRVIPGVEQVTVAMRQRGRVHLVLLADGASDNTVKRILGKCEFYKVGLRRTGVSASQLGDWIGKSYGPMCLGITDEGFARTIGGILDKLEQTDQ